LKDSNREDDEGENGRDVEKEDEVENKRIREKNI